MKTWYAEISGTVPLLSQVQHIKSQIGPNWLHQHLLLGYSKVFELFQTMN